MLGSLLSTTDDEDEDTIMYANKPCTDSNFMSSLKQIVLVEPTSAGRQFLINPAEFTNKFIFNGDYALATCFFKVTRIGEGEVE